MNEMILGLMVLLFVVLVMMFFSNRKLKNELKLLNEVLAIKETTISNLEASRVAVKDVLENFSASDEVMALVDAGESRESISEKLGIPINKIELIIKFDKIKKEKSL